MASINLRGGISQVGGQRTHSQSCLCVLFWGIPSLNRGLTMNETSTGLINPVKEIVALICEKYLDVLILVDAVSSPLNALKGLETSR